MNWITIFGIIFLAIGTFMTIYGPTLNSNKDAEDIKEQISKFSEKLEQAKMDTNPNTKPVDPVKLNKIESEFDEWAKKFINEKAARRLELERKNIDAKEREIELSEAWYPIYSKLFNDIQDYLEAYNVNSGDKIEYNFPSLPTNLFSEKMVHLHCTISFQPKRNWDIFFKVPILTQYNALPKIDISVIEAKDKMPSFPIGDVEFTVILMTRRFMCFRMIIKNLKLILIKITVCRKIPTHSLMFLER